MTQFLISFDIAALAVYAIVILSVFVRDLRKDQTMRFFMIVVVLYAVTCFFAVVEEAFEVASYTSATLPDGTLDPNFALPTWLPLLTLGYYATRLLAAPAYLMFIVNITDTVHTITNHPWKRWALSLPVWVALAFVCSNPWTHAIFTWGPRGSIRAPGIVVLYAIAFAYSLIGLIHLIRWRQVISKGQFIALATLYPLEYVAVVVQFIAPYFRVEMFSTALAVLLITMVVLVPEQLLDPLSGAQSYSSYVDEVHTSLLTGMRYRITYLQIMDYETLAHHIGRDRYHQLLRDVSKRIRDVSEKRAQASVYYLRSGLFCVMEQPTGDEVALAQATSYADAVREGAAGHGNVREVTASAVTLETPTDIADEQALAQFVGRLRQLLPQTATVTTYRALSETRDFELRMNLDKVVAKAIETGGFSMWFQPIYCVHTRRYRSAEALIRLIDDDYGFVSPALFIPAAEQTGQIIQVGDFVLDETARVFEHANLHALGVDYIEINLSIEQCIEDDIVEKVTAALDSHGLAPHMVNLELTETAASVSEEKLDGNVRALFELGYTFSLDDFGTGYSNLARLMRLPFTIIKIDKSLVDGLGNPQADAVVASTIEVIHAIDRKVLAEGVETEEQAERLVEMGIDYIQGYYFARPLPEDDYVQFLKHHGQG